MIPRSASPSGASPDRDGGQAARRIQRQRTVWAHRSLDASKSGRIEGGYRVATKWAALTPYAAGQFTSFWLPAYAESAMFGSKAFALASRAQTTTWRNGWSAVATFE